MIKRVQVGLAAGWLWTALAVANPLPAPEGWAEVFARFDSYGLPDVSTATYVNLMACWEPRVEDLLPDDWETSGNAWMLSEARDAKGQPSRATIVADGSRTFDVVCGGGDGAADAGHSLLEPPAPPKDIVASGRWQEGNAARDAKKGVEFLKSLKWEGEPHGQYRYPGKLFLLARGLWQRGDEASAAPLLAELAAREGGAEGVARDAMNLVADGEYGNLYEVFREDCDWEAYCGGIRGLLEKYPQGWHAAPAMMLLLEKAEARIANPERRPTTADSMSEDDVRQAASMIGIRAWRGGADIYANQPVLWIAPSGWRDLAPKPLDAEMEIRVRGMEAAPFLLALMEEDDVLTDADRCEVSRAGPYRDRFPPMGIENDRTAEARQAMARLAFERMDRPATRGEVARRLLRDMVPEWVLGGSHDRTTKEEFIQAVRDFHAQHRDATEEELAVRSLPGRYSSFNELAVGHLMEVARRKAVPELEAFLLDEDWPVADASEYDLDSAQDNTFKLLKAYAAIRGEEARPLAEAYAAQCRRRADEFLALRRMSKDPRTIERAEKREKALRAMADPLDALPLAKPDDEEPSPLTDGHYDRAVLDAALQAKPLAEVIGAVLVHATSIADPKNRMEIASQVGQRAGSTPTEGLRAVDYAAEWEALISDDRSMPQAAVLVVSERFLCLNEQLFAGANLPVLPQGGREWEERNAGERAARRLLKAHGVRGREWLRGRVRQRLAGVPEEELPAYPMGGAPDEGLMVALRERFAGVADRESAARLAAGLSLTERMALPDMLRREPELNARLKGLANRIEAVLIDGDLGEWNQKLLAWEGKEPTAELLEELRRLAEERSAAGQTFSGKLVRRADFGGYEMVAEATVPVPARVGQQKGALKIAGYAGLACGPDVYGAARWRTGPMPEKNNWYTVTTLGPFEIQLFEEALRQFIGDAMPASEEAFAVFQTLGENQ